MDSVARETTTATDRMDLVANVRELLSECAANVTPVIDGKTVVVPLSRGKMLRTRFAVRVMGRETGMVARRGLASACAAIELAHTASLCHDDVIDNAFVRRNQPALWRSTSASGAVLIGDLLLCEAMELLLETEGGRFTRAFISKVKEVCTAEVEQELVLRGKELDERTCVRLARQKTGPLFAFVGMVCGGRDARLSAALEEAGYAIGTAYQLTDDLVDCVGEEEITGKTLGTDALRRKFTLAHFDGDRRGRVREHVGRLCRDALQGLRPWPEIAGGLECFVASELGPVFQEYVGHIPLDARCAI